jgi:DNA-directed RNA polymerase specialized sigma24 family protein
MFPDDSEIQEILRRIIFCLVGPSEISEDLLQEGLVLIWQMKLSSPDNALGWYRSKCWWFLHDMLKRGRSLDSWKRNAFRAGIPTDEESADCEPAAVELPAAPDDVVELVAARDLFRELSGAAPLRIRCATASSKNRPRYAPSRNLAVGLSL